MCNQTPYRVLGLDPGIASCGFALIDLANQEILEMGSHLFDAPQEDKTKTSLAVVRRNARSVRRNNLRTKNRLNHCLKLLVQAGMVPADALRGVYQLGIWKASKANAIGSVYLCSNESERLQLRKQRACVGVPSEISCGIEPCVRAFGELREALLVPFGPFTACIFQL